MSRVATAQRHASEPSPATLKHFWNLSIADSSLTAHLTSLEIMAQLPMQVAANVNRLLGGVWDAGSENLYSIVAGHTDVVPGPEGGPQQIVAFDIIYKGVLYTFSRGVLSHDPLLNQWSIEGGSINRGHLRDAPPVMGEDGTWSATAPPGAPGEEPGKGKGHTRHKRR